MKRLDSMSVTRRKFISTAALAGAAGALPLAAPSRLLAADVHLDFEGWNYDPEFENMVCAEFVEANPGITVDFVAEPSAQYISKMIARFIGGNPPDALFVRDQTLASWADADYIRPINEFPDWEQQVDGLIGFHREGLEYAGKTWGLPYYGDHIAYIYNADMLEKAGVGAPPSTWDELADQALAIKKAGILDRPMVFPLKSNGGLHWWSAVYASGGSLFAPDGTPQFPDENPAALGVLEFLVKAANELEILDPTSVQMGTAETRLAFAAGKAAFISSARYDLKMLNDPEKSKVAGQAKQVLFPSLTADGPHATVGWTQMFSVTRDTPNPEAAWNLVKYAASMQVAKRYYLKNGVGYAYQALDNDPDIAAETQKWSDQAMFAKQGALAKPREFVSFPWASEWEAFNMQQLQEAVLGRKSAHDALSASAEKAIELKKQNG